MLAWQLWKRALQVHVLLVQLDLGRIACPDCPHNTHRSLISRWNSQLLMLVPQSLHDDFNLLQVAAVL